MANEQATVNVDVTKMTSEQLLAYVAKLTREANEAKAAAAAAEAARKAAEAPIRFTLAKAGGLTCNGLQRFGVTLYREQWERLTSADTIKALQNAIREHGDKLKRPAETHEAYWTRIGLTETEIDERKAAREKPFTARG